MRCTVHGLLSQMAAHAEGRRACWPLRLRRIKNSRRLLMLLLISVGPFLLRHAYVIWRASWEPWDPLDLQVQMTCRARWTRSQVAGGPARTVLPQVGTVHHVAAAISLGRSGLCRSEDAAYALCCSDGGFWKTHSSLACMCVYVRSWSSGAPARVLRNDLGRCGRLGRGTQPWKSRDAMPLFQYDSEGLVSL